MEPSKTKPHDANELDDLEKKKYVEFYSQSYASFYNTTMEKDKSILTVSAGGIGFLITLINFSKRIEIFEYIIFLFASLAFILSILVIIHIFGKNAEYIISLTTESDNCDEKDCRLRILDKISTYAFTIGMILSLSLGITLSYQNIKKEIVAVSDEENTSQTMGQVNESAAGASIIKKSFTGATQLKPNINTQSSSNNDSTQTSTSTNAKNVSITSKGD